MASIDLSKISYYLIAVLTDGRQVHLENAAENIAWEENKRELAVRLNITLRDTAFEGGRLSGVLALCTVIYLYADWGMGQQEIFRGTVWEWEHSHIADDEITITCYDLLYYLQKSTSSAYYAKGKTTKAIISDILNTWSVPQGKYTGANVEHQKLLYKSRAISTMLTETLEDAQKLGGKKSVIRASEGKVDVLARGSNSDIYAFTADSNLIASKDKYSMTSLVTRVVITGKDDSSGRPRVEATLDGDTKYGILQSVQNRGSSTLADAKKAAQEELDENGKPTRTITFSAPDFPPLRKGDMIYAQAGGLEGYFYILGISHNASAMTMQMEVEPK